MLISFFTVYLGIAQLRQQCPDDQELNRRRFDNLAPIEVQIDARERPAQIVPRTYSTKIKPPRGAKASSNANEAHWIAFDLVRSNGRVQKSFFQYQYGTSEADYWVYALTPCDANKDGHMDLLFYAGDDTSDETIILLNRGGTFRIA